jgi:hypothetical protein
MSRMDFSPRRRPHRNKGAASAPRPERPTEACVTDRPDGDDPPGRSADDEAGAFEQSHTELLEIITGELRTSWAAARQAGAGPEELRRLLEERRKILKDRSGDPDG